MNKTPSPTLKTRRTVRLLPVVIVSVAALLVVRLGELSFGIDLFPASPALAAGHDTNTSEPNKSNAAAATNPAAQAAGARAEDAAQEESPAVDFPVEFTPGEVAVLQDLAIRRDKLDKLERDLASRERLLNAAEGRLEDRIGELQQLRTSIEGLVRQYNDQEKAELQSIVKIYETMKPKDAARILEELDMKILLGIMEIMKERKSASILAAMEPKRAREVTTELARKREIDLSAAADKPGPSG